MPEELKVPKLEEPPKPEREVPQLEVPAEKAPEPQIPELPKEEVKQEFDDINFDNLDLEGFEDASDTQEKIQETEPTERITPKVEETFEPAPHFKEGPCFIKIEKFREALESMTTSREILEIALESGNSLLTTNSSEIKNITDKLGTNLQQIKNKIITVEKKIFKGEK